MQNPTHLCAAGLRFTFFLQKMEIKSLCVSSCECTSKKVVSFFPGNVGAREVLWLTEFLSEVGGRGGVCLQICHCIFLSWPPQANIIS
ncbi:hypothetical protein GDO78_021253 [Eleutherodactylus coqui]|uniref:Uncharacterized protein n=1 Tax=Eleutherodactylus coqui TaxID=57060 RepID=A0A8J6EHE7_ELECQ|nr:hypothetical protein GDO78_021253 [Eleutherodactylus coqui]